MLSKEQLTEIIQSYENISECMKTLSPYDILSSVSEIFNIPYDTLANRQMGGFDRSGTAGTYEAVLSDLKTNIEYYDRIYSRLEDDESKRVFYLLVAFRLIPDTDYIKNASDSKHSPFMDTDIIGQDDNKVFVDCSMHDNRFISLDEEVSDAVTNIIFDTGEFEITAITGAKNHIRNDRPQIAAGLNHFISDLWEIPVLIDSICVDCHFFIRQYGETTSDKTVLYAIPRRIRPINNKLRTAATIYFDDTPWADFQLTKDCGLIPYLLHKNHGMDVTIVGAIDDPVKYPSAKLINGVNLVPLSDYSLNTRLTYLYNNGANIDLLILYGAYPSNAVMASLYKQVNPNGMIYLSLDINSGWADRIVWTDRDYQDIIKYCDILGASCTAMVDMVSKKWRASNIYLITNGYYSFLKHEHKQIPFKDKNNTILTVGRLGTEQKNTELLLNAFASISESIPEWNLKLVGSIDEAFKSKIDIFFKDHPRLKNRVTFTGPINDKDKLISEYESSKIFALPSRWEGAPNVIAESLTCGCVSAVTKFDAWADCIENGKCGMASQDNEKEYANILLALCKSEKLEEMSDEARKYASEFYDMGKNVDRLYTLLSNEIIKGRIL